LRRASARAGSPSGLLQVQVGYRLAEIKLRRRGETVIAVGQIHLVRVHRENLRLRVPPLDLQGEQHLLHLSPEAPLAAVQKEVPGQLHRDRACALGFPVLQDVAVSRSGHAREIHAPVILEMLVLDRRYGVVQNLGCLLPGHQDPPLQRETPDQLPVVGINLRHHVRPVGFERADFRQVAFVHEQQTSHRPERNRAQQQKRQRHAVNQFPAA